MVGHFCLFYFSLLLTVFELHGKKFLVKTKDSKNIDKGTAAGYSSGEDYTYGRSMKHNKVEAGSTTKLRCESPRPFNGCKFRSPSGEVYDIGIGGGSSYDNARIDCLCTVEDYDPTLVCGLLIKDLRHEDTGEWRCELEFKRYGKTLTKASTKYLEVYESGSTYIRNEDPPREDPGELDKILGPQENGPQETSYTRVNWGTANMQEKEVDFPAKNLDDLMSVAYQKGAIGVQHHPDNLSGSKYWKIIYRLNGIAASEQNSWPLYIRSDLVPHRWLPGGNATGESIQLSIYRRVNWGNNHMQSKEVDFPAKNLDDLMSVAYQKGANGVQHHPDNLSGSAYWKIIYRLNGIAASSACSWPLYIRSDLVPQRWLPGGNATGESIQVSIYRRVNW